MTDKDKQFKAFKEKDDAEQKRRRNNVRIKKIMQDPNSPERQVYDKLLKGKPGFPDLDKVDKKEKKTKKMKDGGEVKRHHSYAGGYEHGIKVEKNIKNKVIKKVEDTVAHRLSNKIPGQKNKKFSAGYNQGKADYKKAKDAEKVKKLNKGGTVIVDRNYLKGR